MSLYGRSHGTSHQVNQIERYRQSLPGWRWALETARELLTDMSRLKGAQEFRYRLESLLHEIGCSLAAGDLTFLRNTTATADMAIALAEADKAFPNGAWMFGRGRGSDKSEGRYGFAVFAAANDDTPIAESTGDDPRECVRQAIKQIEGRAAA